MKKIICIAVLCLVCALSFYGCSGKKEEGGTGRMNMVMGKIEAIDGNKITLALADTGSMFGGGERPSGERPENFNPEDFEGQMPENFNPENFEGQMPEGLRRHENGERPEGGMPQSGGMRFDASSLTYSGEKETYTVPEGMKIGDGYYTSLKVREVIMIRFDNEGGISEIMVMTAEAGAEEITEE